ncbi:hypothetical protein [Microbacterium sp. LWH3-1.2]|uniref:hypothetical protein n=1 Tax=Microbacterium sp. LWH3-1.2 TaxID=3135256 RepID=UPI003436C5FE
MGRGADMFGIADAAVADLYESTAHELAYALASASVRIGEAETDPVLASTINVLLGDGERGPDQVDVTLTLVIRHLLQMLRNVAAGSAHPVIERLRTDTDLTSAKAAAMILDIERALRDGVLS